MLYCRGAQPQLPANRDIISFNVPHPDIQLPGRKLHDAAGMISPPQPIQEANPLDNQVLHYCLPSSAHSCLSNCPALSHAASLIFRLHDTGLLSYAAQVIGPSSAKRCPLSIPAAWDHDASAADGNAQLRLAG